MSHNQIDSHLPTTSSIILKIYTITLHEYCAPKILSISTYLIHKPLAIYTPLFHANRYIAGKDPQPQPNMATKLVGFDFDHPAFVSRLPLTVETCLQFLAAGAGHGVLSVACTGLLGPQLWNILSRYIPGRISQNFLIDLLINGRMAWKSFSPRMPKDYQLRYGNNPSSSRLLLLESLRLSGFFFSKWLLLRRTTIFARPLSWMISDPPLLLSGLYATVIFWGLFRLLPELTAISSSAFTIPKFVARLVGMTAQLDIQEQQQRLASGILRLVAPASTMTPYQYTLIRTPRTIRLLRIDSTQGTPLCSLETMNLDDAVDFWAVVSLGFGKETCGTKDHRLEPRCWIHPNHYQLRGSYCSTDTYQCAVSVD